MPGRDKNFRCVCIICCDNNPDGRDILLSEWTVHLLRAKRKGALSSQRDTLLVETPAMPLTLQYLDSSVYSQSIPFPSRYAARTEKREKNHLTKKAHTTFNVVERRANEILNHLAMVDNSAGVQVIEENIAVIRLAFESVKRRVPTIDSRREKISRLFTQIDGYLPELCAQCPPSIEPLVHPTGMFNVVIFTISNSWILRPSLRFSNQRLQPIGPIGDVLTCHLLINHGCKPPNGGFHPQCCSTAPGLGM